MKTRIRNAALLTAGLAAGGYLMSTTESFPSFSPETTIAASSEGQVNGNTTHYQYTTDGKRYTSIDLPLDVTPEQTERQVDECQDGNLITYDERRYEVGDFKAVHYYKALVIGSAVCADGAITPTDGPIPVLDATIA